MDWWLVICIAMIASGGGSVARHALAREWLAVGVALIWCSVWATITIWTN